MDINNPDHYADIQKALKEGVKTDFWDIIVQGLDREMASLKDMFEADDMDTMNAEDYRISFSIVKAKKNFINKMKSLPEDIFFSAHESSEEQEVLDPYRKPKDFLLKK